MFGQIFASRSLVVLMGRTRMRTRPALRSVPSSSDLSETPSLSSHPLSNGRAGRWLFEAVASASKRRHWGAEPGMVFHLVCIGVVGFVIITVFVGAGLYSLRRPNEELVPNSGAHNHAAVAASLAERPATSVGPPPSGAEAPAPIAAPLGMVNPSLPDSAQRGPTGKPGSEAPRADATATALGAPSEPRPDPMQRQGGAISDLKPPSVASTQLVSGTVTDAPDAMTWIVGDQIVHLWGIRPGPQNMYPFLNSLVEWVRIKGPVKCRKQAHSSRYQCFTASREDIAEAALLAGIGRTADGATVAYRGAEAQAHRQGKGLWAKP